MRPAVNRENKASNRHPSNPSNEQPCAEFGTAVPQLFCEILKEEGYEDWSIKEIKSGGGLCVFKTKQIWLDTKYLDNIFWFLHEVAHIRYPNHENEWGNYFTRLLVKYVKQ